MSPKKTRAATFGGRPLHQTSTGRRALPVIARPAEGGPKQSQKILRIRPALRDGRGAHVLLQPLPSRRSDDAVGLESAGGLKSFDGFAGLRTDLAVGRAAVVTG